MSCLISAEIRSTGYLITSSKKRMIMATVKMKKESEQDRLSKPSFPLPRFTRGAKVQVYMGAGWSVGSVVDSRQDSCSVRLITGNRLITIKDARSIRKSATAD